MKKAIFAALVLSFAAAANAQVDFDRGLNTKSFAEQAALAELPVPAPAAPSRLHYSRDCARFSFGPADGELLSQKVYLRSTEYETVCYTQYVQQCHTVMVPGPNGTQVAQQVCNNVPQQVCHEQPGMTWGEYAQVRMEPRKLFAWERDSFDVCLEGRWLDIYRNDAAYRYTSRREGGAGETLFVLTPHEKVAMKADEDGINYSDFAFKDGKFVFKAADKWAREYAGEKVVIKVDLYSEGWWVFNGYKGSKEFTLDAADLYTLTFDEKDLAKPETPDTTTREDDRGAKKFFLKWSFKRVGQISKANEVKKDKTPSVTK